MASKRSNDRTRRDAQKTQEEMQKRGTLREPQKQRRNKIPAQKKDEKHKQKIMRIKTEMQKEITDLQMKIEEGFQVARMMKSKEFLAMKRQMKEYSVQQLKGMEKMHRMELDRKERYKEMLRLQVNLTERVTANVEVILLLNEQLQQQHAQISALQAAWDNLPAEDAQLWSADNGRLRRRL